jgi:hypothetical protein
VAPGSPAPASKPQGSHCLQTWVFHTCSSCQGSWKPTPQLKQTPGPLLPCGHHMLQAHWLCCPKGILNLLLSATSQPPHF